MTAPAKNSLAPVLYIPHGGGPLPLFGHAGHGRLVRFLQTIPAELGVPEAILLISAHWEAARPTLTGSARPSLVYDYSGFPPEAYKVEYPAQGHPQLAGKIQALLKEGGSDARVDTFRGFDHGLFVPLKIMYPEAAIPCVQLSLVEGLDPVEHIRIGKALADLRTENILTIGSGFSFHNMKAFSFSDNTVPDEKNDNFDLWLRNTCTREEHLLPLQVCYGMAATAAEVVFNDFVLGKRATALLWR
jgi:aromatic ring-opening dioxygenase catalytic subunit (LigB family)